jgi:hypothetical protein
MRRTAHSILCFAAVVGAASAVIAAEPLLISGTYQKGSNVTEPRPNKSEFLQTSHGGVAVIGDKAGYYLFTRVLKKPDKDLYVRVEYENPTGGPPLTNDMVFRRDLKELHFSAPEFVKDLRSYSDYRITVKIFESRDAREPIDTLRQTIRCYVDTSGAKIKLYNKLKLKS